MGIWDFIGSAAETVEQNAPDAAAAAKDACRNSYTYGAAAFTKIDQAARVDRLGQWMPDDETKSKIGLYTTKFAENAGLYALQEGYKLVPGGVAFSEILSKTLNEVQQENLKGEHLAGGRKLIAGENMPSGGGVKSVSGNGYQVGSAIDKSPEDVIRIFMMKEFFGNRFLDGLMVQESASGKRKKPE